MGNSMKKEVQVILEVRNSAHGAWDVCTGVVVTDGLEFRSRKSSKTELSGSRGPTIGWS